MSLKSLRVPGAYLSSVPADILTEAVFRLKEFVPGGLLTPVQVQNIFSKIVDCETPPLIDLSINKENVSLVPENILGKAVSKLNGVSIHIDDFPRSKINIIFTHLAEGESHLKELSVSGTEDEYQTPYLRGVPADILVKVISRLEKCYLSIELDGEQSDAFWNFVWNERNIVAPRLKELYLTGYDEM